MTAYLIFGKVSRRLKKVAHCQLPRFLTHTKKLPAVSKLGMKLRAENLIERKWKRLGILDQNRTMALQKVTNWRYQLLVQLRIVQLKQFITTSKIANYPAELLCLSLISFPISYHPFCYLNFGLIANSITFSPKWYRLFSMTLTIYASVHQQVQAKQGVLKCA